MTRRYRLKSGFSTAICSCLAAAMLCGCTPATVPPEIVDEPEVSDSFSVVPPIDEIVADPVDTPDESVTDEKEDEMPPEDEPVPDEGENPDEETVPPDDGETTEDENPDGDNPDENTPDGDGTDGNNPEGEKTPEGGENENPDEGSAETTGFSAAIEGQIAESESAPDSYFDDAVFIGDSVSLMLKYYASSMRGSNPNFLGKAQFLCSGSFGFRNAILPVSDESLHPSYNGTKQTVEASIAQMGAKKVYIMLGMNDVAGKNYTNTLKNATTLVSRIREKSPDTVFYFQSVTPRMKDSQIKSLNNEIIFEFNKQLAAYCAENGHYFVNVYEAVCDENGDLTKSYCSDPVSSGGMGIHFTYDGCEKWVDYLYKHTA